MANGISVYLGLDNTLEENLTLIKKAAKAGITRIFTSLHIPEANTKKLQSELKPILQLAKKENLDVISDVSPNTLALLKMDRFSLNEFARLGLTTLRLDYGFSTKEIADLTNNSLGIKIQLNASTITQESIIKLFQAGVNPNALEASHNFFPRENTGLSESFIAEKNRLLHRHHIAVSAFIPSFNRPRSPIGAGLPTMELHRTTSFDFSLRHLLALGIDSVFVGDSLPCDEELTLLSKLTDNHVVFLRPALHTAESNIINLISKKFTTRIDEAQDVIRTQESRQYLKEAGFSVQPEHCGKRNYGCITLDNQRYGRYQGELQILKSDLPADHRVNVVASLPDSELNLLKYLQPGVSFKLLV